MDVRATIIEPSAWPQRITVGTPLRCVARVTQGAADQFQWLLDGRHTETLAYSEFKQALLAGKLDDVLIADGVATGKLRAAINLGNPILAGQRAETGEVFGVSVDLARGFAERLGVALELKVVDTAAKSVDLVTREEADIGFFAVDPKRGAGIHFTAPYVLIEGCYLVRDESPFTRNEEVDHAGIRLVVGKGSAYDLFLSREIQAATLERAPSSPAVVDHFIATGADVAAGVKQQLEADAARLGGLRLLPGRFMVIQQAMGCPKGRGDAAAQALFDQVDLRRGQADPGHLADQRAEAVDMRCRAPSVAKRTGKKPRLHHAATSGAGRSTRANRRSRSSTLTTAPLQRPMPISGLPAQRSMSASSRGDISPLSSSVTSITRSVLTPITASCPS